MTPAASDQKDRVQDFDLWMRRLPPAGTRTDKKKPGLYATQVLPSLASIGMHLLAIALPRINDVEPMTVCNAVEGSDSMGGTGVVPRRVHRKANRTSIWNESG